MDKYDLYINLEKNINELVTTEDEISMTELAIYQKSIENIKSKKLKELEEYFNNQAKIYNQNNNIIVNEIKETYNSQLDRIIDNYDNFYLYIFRTLKNALNNQNIAIANIVTLNEQRNKENISDDEKNKITNKIIACAQKKLDYSVIIEECRARMSWCTENIQSDINNIFSNDFYQLQIYNQSFFTKIKMKLINKFTGKNKYKKIIEKYKNENILEIKKQNKIKITDLILTFSGFIKQMENTNKQINFNYNKINNN